MFRFGFLFAVFLTAAWPQASSRDPARSRQIYESALKRLQADHDLDAAEAGFSEALRLDPASVLARLRLSEIATSKGQWASARKLLEEASSTDEASRRDPDVQRRLTFVRFAEGHASGKAVACRPEFTQPPKILSRVEPEYNQDAGRANIDRGIALYVEVNQAGESQNVQVLRGLEPGLDSSAVDALRKWKWAPGARNGKPLVCVAEITVTFKRPSH
jgi:TonB family protein